MSYHYWITNSRSGCIGVGNILNVYNLITPGENVVVKRKLYKHIKSVKTNRTISMVENKVVGELNIDVHFNLVHISDKCRIFYNSQLTLLEIDGCSSTIALEIFSLVANNEDEFVMFDIDDRVIPKK